MHFQKHALPAIVTKKVPTPDVQPSLELTVTFTLMGCSPTTSDLALVTKDFMASLEAKMDGVYDATVVDLTERRYIPNYVDPR